MSDGFWCRFLRAMSPSRSCQRTTVQGSPTPQGGSHRWSKSEEIGWVQSQEIRWFPSQEIGGPNQKKFCITMPE